MSMCNSYDDSNKWQNGKSVLRWCPTLDYALSAAERERVFMRRDFEDQVLIILIRQYNCGRKAEFKR